MNGKFYWLKLRKDFLKRHDIKILESMPDGQLSVLFYLKIMLESIDHEGELRFSDKVPYTPEMLATITDTDIEVTKTSIQRLQDLGMIETKPDGTIVVDKVKEMIGCAADNDNARRQKRFRDKKKAENSGVSDDSVTKSNAGALRKVTRDRDRDRDRVRDIKDISVVSPVISREESEAERMFNQFWEAYPNRRKVNKKGCKAKFLKIPDLEKIFPDILNALEIQKKSIDWTKDGGQFIPMPMTLLNQERWTLIDTRTEREQIAGGILKNRLGNYF